MKLHLMLPLGVLMLLLVAACAPPPNLRDDTLLNDTSLITGEPCGPPCFRGITPGETSWRDALTIIEDIPNFRNLETQTEEDSGAQQAAWQEGDNQVCCQMAAQDGETVSLLFLRTAPNMTFGEVIEQHGEPEYLVGVEFTPDQAIMNVIYPEIPMVIYVFVEGTETGELRASSEIIGMLYFTEEDMDLLLQTSDLHTWEGFQSYQAYAESEFEVTPAITLTPSEE